MRTRAATLALFFIGSATLPMTLAAAESKDHSAVSRYAGSTLTRRDDDGHRSYSLIVRVDEKGKSDEEILVPLRVEASSHGSPTRIRRPLATEVFANYAGATAGFRSSSPVRRRHVARPASSRWAASPA
jgi:hypothetical protein